MPDRALTTEELQRFINEAAEGKVSFKALKTFHKEKTKPTLHDLCISELYAIAEAQRRIIIEQGRAIKTLKQEVKSLWKRTR